MNGESPMSDPREALVAREVRTSDGRTLTPAQVAAHDGIQRRLTWPSMHWGVEGVHPDAWPHIAMAAADAILAAGWTPRGEGMTIQIGGSRAGKTQALAERVADEVMERGGSATVTSLPSVEDVRDEIAGHPIGSGYYSTTVGVDEATEMARAVLALLPGRTEAEVKAEALREAAPGCNCEDDYAWLNDRADRIEKGEGRG